MGFIMIENSLIMLGFDTGQAGYAFIHYVLSKALEEGNNDWSGFDRYITIVAAEYNQSEHDIIRPVNESIAYALQHDENNILKSIFSLHSDCMNYISRSYCNLFFRTVLSILFFCEGNNIDFASSLMELRHPEYSIENNMNYYLAGYLMMVLKELGMNDAEIDKSAVLIDGILKNNSFGEAFITYLKYKSELFMTVSLEDITVPPELHNKTISDLQFDNENTRTRVKNALKYSGIIYLKDFRYKSSEDIKRTRNLGDKLYNALLSALRRTVENENE